MSKNLESQRRVEASQSRVETRIETQLTWYSRIKLIFIILAVAAFTLTTITLMLVLSEVSNNTDAINKSVEQLQSCIDPKGTCYKSGDRRSGAAVKTINETQKKIVVAASFCANQPENQTVKQIESCVNKELAK